MNLKEIKERHLNVADSARGMTIKISKQAHQDRSYLLEALEKARGDSQTDALVLLDHSRRIQELEATIERIREVSEDSTLSWQDKHIATWRIVHPKAAPNLMVSRTDLE